MSKKLCNIYHNEKIDEYSIAAIKVFAMFIYEIIGFLARSHVSYTDTSFLHDEC